MKRYRIIIAVAVLCLLLSGCKELSLNSEELLSPPSADGKQAEIQSLIEQNSGGSYTLIYPSSGEYKSAVVFYDIDGDGSEEAIAMYSTGEDSARILVARRGSSGYAMLGEGKIKSSLIERIDFSDLNGDGTKEIILDYPEGSSPLLSLTVLIAHDKLAQRNLPTSCSAYVCGDFNGDEIDELMLLALNSSVSTASARLITYSDSELVEAAACEMDTAVSAFAKVTYGVIGDGKKGIVIDGRSSTGEYSTQVIYYDEGSHSLINPLFVYSGYQSTRRTTAIYSGDVDRDEIIEIPICNYSDYTPKENVSTVCMRVTWNNYSPSTLELVSKKTALLCENLGFMLNISEDRVGDITARYVNKNTVTVYAWDFKGDDLTRTDPLLTIHYYPKESYDSSKIIEAVLCETNTGVYTYVIEPTENYTPFSDDEVTGGFALLDTR